VVAGIEPAVVGGDQGDIDALAFEFLGQGAHDVSKTAGLGEGVHLGSDKEDLVMKLHRAPRRDRLLECLGVDGRAAAKAGSDGNGRVMRLGPVEPLEAFGVVVQDAGVVETQRRRPAAHRKDGQVAGIVPGRQGGEVHGLGREDHAQGVLPGIAVGIGIDAEQPGQFHIEADFLLGLADGRRFHGFAIIHETAGQCPAEGFVLPFNEYHAASGNVHENIHRRHGVAVVHHGPSAVGAGLGQGHYRAPLRVRRICRHRTAPVAGTGENILNRL